MWAKQAPKKVKLSYKLQRELDGLPENIANIENQIAALRETTLATGFYDQEYDQVQEILAQLTTLEADLERATERWVELEEMQQANGS